MEPIRGPGRGGKDSSITLVDSSTVTHPSDRIAFQKLIGEPTAEDGVAVNDTDLGTDGSIGIRHMYRCIDV